mmetsp:Transcript_74825/g.188397  ORF Transcript_74825/g.188397 Transcript_74825/m.188397 type:complete len:964 (+) Transcript_74825:104-2995(+)
MAEQETYAFNADISQLMSLIINAFYSNKEIFLRELISNASDAMDKIQYQATQDPEKLASNPDLGIKVTPDREARTVTVEDAGIGMTRDELITNLGTIAKSGTKAFMEAVSSGVDMSMIGQFGVGFYSAYLVSEKVRVVSKSNEDEQHVWESAAGGTFLVWKDENFEHGRLKRGTKVICYLKDDQHEFLESDRLKDLIMKHSAFVGFPIDLYMEHRREEDVPGSDEKLVTVTHQWELINKNKPVWLRPPETVTHQEYSDLYKWFANDWQDHLGVKHVIQSGQVDFKALLFCPREAPKDMFDMGKMAQRFSIRLYVRRVFIKEFNDLIPKWMGFIKGIVDSDDMPLNIGREKLQQNAILKHIKTSLQKNIFALFNEIAKDPERNKTFQESFSQCLKLGVYEDNANRENIIPLLRYFSSKSGDNLVSLEEYVGRMKPGQRHILYITGRSKRDAARSPYIEGLRRDGYEILYMIDPVDEYAVQFLKEYQGNELLSCMHGQAARLLDHRTEDDLKAELDPVRKRLEAALAGKVSAVSLGKEMSSDSVGRHLPGGEGELPQLELNFKHGLVKELAKRSAEDTELPHLAEFLLQASALDGADADDARRDSAAEKTQELIQRLSVGEKDSNGEDLPPLGGPPVPPPVDLSTGKAAAGGGGDKAKELLCCGGVVRVARPDRARRAIISFVDEDDGLVDVMYPKWGGGEEEEEGVNKKFVQKLLDFELAGCAAKNSDDPAFKESFYKTASAVKEEGNQLFKLKDFEAAHERYTVGVEAFAKRPISQGQQVLAVSQNGDGKPDLVTTSVASLDAEGNCELRTGAEMPSSSLLPIVQELLPLQTSLHMNRARCRQNLGMHLEAAQDLTAVLALWKAADRRMLEADPEMKEAEAKGLYTAEYLRGRSRLALGRVKQASNDVKDALARSPPAGTVKQLRELKAEVQAAQEKHRQVNGPLAKELAKVAIAIRGGPKIS